jgi:hypothetical protein
VCHKSLEPNRKVEFDKSNEDDEDDIVMGDDDYIAKQSLHSVRFDYQIDPQDPTRAGLFDNFCEYQRWKPCGRLVLSLLVPSN